MGLHSNRFCSCFVFFFCFHFSLCDSVWALSLSHLLRSIAKQFFDYFCFSSAADIFSGITPSTNAISRCFAEKPKANMVRRQPALCTTECTECTANVINFFDLCAFHSFLGDCRRALARTLALKLWPALVVAAMMPFQVFVPLIKFILSINLLDAVINAFIKCHNSTISKVGILLGSSG